MADPVATRPRARPAKPGGSAITARRVDLAGFLTLASAAASALEDWHDAHGVHGRLRPEVFLLTGEAGVRLVTTPPGDPPRFAHLAPEQLGQLARGVDERSDLYALGVVLYELLTGRLPFRDPGGLDLAHHRPSRTPVPPARLIPDLPRPVEEITLKLLADLPEDRYQCAAGLVADLDRCRHELASRGRIEPFRLGGEDLPDRLLVSGRLYGRQQRLNVVTTVGNRVRAEGPARFVGVAGDPGVGKSAFAAALAGRVTEAGGWMLVGKFLQRRQAAPYAAVAQALSRPAGVLLAEPGTPLPLAARTHADVLAELIPALSGAGAVSLEQAGEFAGGSGGDGLGGALAPATSGVIPYRPGSQLREAVRRFLTELAAPDRPVVLVFDDLQWADPGSLHLLAELLDDPDVQHLLVIGTYRPRDIQRGHPLGPILKDLRRRKVATTVALRPLPDTALAELLADTLVAGSGASRSLARVIADKTGSNPLVVGQFLHHLCDRGLLRHHPSGPGWVWDLERIQAVPACEDLARLVEARLGQRASRHQRLLETAALLGHRIDLPVLSAAAGEPIEDVATELEAAAQAHLLVRADEAFGAHAHHGSGSTCATYHWLNDAIRQAVKFRIPPGRLRGQHARIADALARAHPVPDRYERIFDLVWHQTAGAGRRATDPERLRLAELSLAAGRKANRLGDLETARAHLAKAVAQLPATAWTGQRELALAVYAEASRTERLAGDHRRAGHLLETTLARSPTDLDGARLLQAQVGLLAAHGDRAGAVTLGLRGLALAGLDLPADLTAASRRVCERLRNTSLDGLADAPRMSDPRAVLAATLVADLLCALPDRPELSGLLAATGVGLALDHGPTGASSVAFARFDPMAGGGDCDDGIRQRCLHVALRLLDELPAGELRARATLLVAAAVPIWYGSPRHALDLFRRVHRDGLESGAVDLAVTGRALYHQHLLATGAPLAQVASEIDAVRRLRARYPAATRTVADDVDSASAVVDDAVCRLRGQPGRSGVAAVPAQHLTSQIMAAYLLGDYPEALRLCEAHEAQAADQPADFLATERTFYHALTLAVLYRGAGPARRRAWQAKLDALHADLERWAGHGPPSFGHKELLVSAERARLAGDTTGAMGRYDRAIGQAKEFGFVHIEAMAAELAGRYVEQRDDGVERTAYLRRARNCYLRWHALAKVDQVDQALRTAHPPRQPARLSDQLDLLTVVKACQALTTDLELDKTLATLLELLVQHSGAERGCLLLPEAGGIRVAAAAEIDGSRVEIAHDPPGRLDQHVPRAVVQYTYRTGELVASGEPESRRFASDPYLSRRQPRAFLCAPIARRHRPVAILYLEHRQLTDVFAPAQRDVLEILCAQAAIALENATIYARLAESNQVLDATLDELPVGLILLHPDLIVRRASARAAQLCGAPIEPGTPLRHVWESVGGSPEMLQWAAMAGAQRAGPRRMEITSPAREQPRSLDVWTGPLRDEQGLLVGIAITFLEVTGGAQHIGR